MNSVKTKKSFIRIPPSQYWGLNWRPCPIGSLATIQLLMTLTIVAMEIGNSLVDIYRANVFSGFWSFPFTMSATITTYASICMKKTQTKARIALVCQSIAIFILLIVIGFLIAFMASSFTLCLGAQCDQTSTTFISIANSAYISFSSTQYIILKRAFIISEFVCAVFFILCSIGYIFFFIKCLNETPNVPVITQVPILARESTIEIRSIKNEFYRSVTKMQNTTVKASTHDESERMTSAIQAYYKPEKICPNCKHASSYVGNEKLLECPKCGYQSHLVEHAQQS